MKRTLQEELQKIHNITYGEETLTDDFFNNILSKIGLNTFDDPKKADLVSKDVEQLYTSLEDAIDKGGLSQQRKGSMGFQKEVESMQIGLTLLGYTLPQYGIDGLFGPETASAVSEFTKDNVESLKESASELRSTLDDLDYDEKGNELSSGGEITDEISVIVSDILKEYATIKPNVKVVVTAGNDKFHHNLSYKSKHTDGRAVDLVLKPYNSANAAAFIGILKKYKSQDAKFSFLDEYTRPTKFATGGHFHLQYDESKPEGRTFSKSSSGSIIQATPEMLTELIRLLKSKNIEDNDLKQYLDSTVLARGGKEKLTSTQTEVGKIDDLDLNTTEGYNAYRDICQKFIDGKSSNLLGITGSMLANSAKKTYNNNKSYVPPELALAQLAAEGGFSSDPKSRPIRTKNPYNVGNVESGSNIQHSSVQSGIDTYYSLIARNYLTGGKGVDDLLNNFVNKNGQRYATGKKYEDLVKSIANKVKQISQPIYASINKKKGMDIA